MCITELLCVYTHTHTWSAAFHSCDHLTHLKPRISTRDKVQRAVYALKNMAVIYNFKRRTPPTVNMEGLIARNTSRMAYCMMTMMMMMMIFSAMCKDAVFSQTKHTSPISGQADIASLLFCKWNPLRTYK
jgi:hypothetical protein